MSRVSSFKAQYRPAPARSSTPPRPVLEPLSPVLRPTAPPTAHPAGDGYNATARSSERANGGATGSSAARENGIAPLPLSSPAVTYGAPLPGAPPPLSLPSYAVPLGSAGDGFVDTAMASLHTSPLHIEMARHAPHAATSPATAPYPTSERAPKHAFASDAAYSYSERPAKRARSEYQTSPPHGQHQSRPATSHIPGYAYNVEQAMDSGLRMYQESRASAPQQAPGGDKMLSDAELLLFFSNVSAHTAQTPPSTAKRWSVSQPSPIELPSQQTQQTDEPYVGTAQPSSPRQHVPISPDVKHHPEPPAHPLDVTEVAPESQTRTPPEEATSVTEQAVMQEAAPAPKKHQGWPKGKPRGPRSTPSTGKRKRSTPKPKGAPADTSTAPDQLQSPQSLPADHPAAMALDRSNGAPQGVELHEASPRNRRHSFSTSFAHSASDEATTASFRAQSVPLGAVLPITAPIDPSRLPLNKPTTEQPDLICASCKSSDSAVKVGDGEQWIGCDGCKEWYHYACAGFSSEREVRDVNKFYCGPCRPKFGETTSRSTDAPRRYNSNLVQRFENPSESTRRLIMPVSMKASSRLPTTTPSITISPHSRMET
jgi:F-box/leucine-rich repeat protein 10/11